jgi:RNA polymerase sigma factor (sigma-70 family)
MAAEPKESSDRSSGQDKEASRSGLDRLALRYYAPLASFFRKRTRDTAEVQDLVQQVFLRLAQHRELGEIRNAEGYIFQTASNTLKDHIRNTAVRERFIREKIEIGEEGRSDFSPERVLLGRESVAQLAAALRQLPERTRDVFMLRCFEGLKHAEIARLQGVSVRTVEKHLERALAHLGKAVERGALEQGHGS